jgi:hypothetical protein
VNSIGNEQTSGKAWHSGWRGGAITAAVAVLGAGVITLVIVGFIVAGYLDAAGASSVLGVGWLASQPRPLRLAIEVVIGLPIAFGAALYVITQLIELAWLVSWPFKKVMTAIRRSN